MNAGSGGWWIYGEDASRYYHHEGHAPAREISRKAARHCPGFDPHQVETWCR